MPLFEAIEVWAAAAGLTAADFASWGAGWARALPVVLIVPAFGLRAVALPIRLLLALALAVAVAPSIAPVPDGGLAALAREALAGVPVALAAAAALWAGTMAGGLIDDLRGARPPYPEGLLEADSSPLGGVLTLLVTIAFFEMGGAAQVARAVAGSAPPTAGLFENAARDVVRGITLAVSITAPLMAVSVVFEAASAVLVRGTASMALSLVAPLRSLVLLMATAILFEGLAELIAGRAIAW